MNTSYELNENSNFYKKVRSIEKNKNDTEWNLDKGFIIMKY